MRAADLGRVAVLHGGWSAEREVSLESGRNAHEALLRRGVDATLIDATPARVLGLAAAGFERVFIALHGRGGEDGQVQAALELQDLPYTGSRQAACALAMHKPWTKQVFEASGLPTPRWRQLGEGFDPQAVAAELGLPIFVKPGAEGSSIGMTRVSSAEELPAAYARAREYDSRVLAERFIQGGEYTATVLNGEPLPLIRIAPAQGYYDYHAKYQAEDTAYHCPCGLSEDQEQRLRELALSAYQVIGVRGWGRVDFMLDADGAPWLLEVNTVPGLTTHSLVPMAARAAGIDFDELIWRILLTSTEVGT